MKANRKNMLRTAVFAALSLPVMLFANAMNAPASADEFDDAMAAYEIQHYRKALALFEQAAEGGDARAQEIVALMLLYGPRLYCDEIAADPARALDWLDRAARNGSETAQAMLQRFNAKVAAANGEALRKAR